MDNSVLELATRISASSDDEISFVARQIERLNEMDPRFGSRLLALFERPSEISNVYLQSNLRSTLTDNAGLNRPVSRYLVADPVSGVVDNAAAVILYEATLIKSVADITFPSDYSRGEIIRDGKEGDFYLRHTGKYPKPDPFTATIEELNRYFRPIAVAASLLNGSGGVLHLGDEFEAEAPVFMEWVGTQENMDEVLLAALKWKTLNPRDIAESIAMQKGTPLPLHDGLI